MVGAGMIGAGMIGAGRLFSMGCAFGGDAYPSKLRGRDGLVFGRSYREKTNKRGVNK